MNGKRICFLLSFVLIMSLGAVPPVFGESGERMMTLDEIRQPFSDPPVDYRSVPFWSWNDRMTREEIDLQLEDFKDKGIGGVFMHPRYGLITEYLSDEWFEMVSYTVEKCRELGMEAWIYDENSYPSGFAGGHVPAEMPESYNQGQGLKMTRVSSLDADSRDEAFLVLRKGADGAYLVIKPEKGEQPSEGSGDFLVFEKVYHGRSKWYGGFSYVDLMVEGVTEKFIDVTMTGYEQHVGDEFSGIVPGVFTDEPNIAVPNSNEAIRWTPDLFPRFREKWGYSLEENLPSLFEETGDWRKVRHNYQSVLLDLFIERWSRPWWEYTEKHNLQWTGHYWEHGWPSPRHGPDNMAMYAWHQVPAIDLLFNRFGRQVQFGNVRNVKELSSVANQLGRHRTLSETYGGGGWELRFEDMKRLGDWEYVLGVNFLNQHLSHVTLKGDRKHDYPQSFTYHNPWWEYYRPLADYYARLSVTLSSGFQENRVLVLEPTTTGWIYAAPGNDNPAMEPLDESFTRLTDDLERMHVEYDLGCENIIRDHGRVIGSSLSVGERSYNKVVIPENMVNLDRSTYELLSDYLANGGTLVLLGKAPQLVDGAVHSGPDGWAEEYREGLVMADTPGEVADLLLPEDFRISFDSGGNLLYHHRRRMTDGQVLFLVNSSLDEDAAGELQVKGEGLLKMDLFTGQLEEFPCGAAERDGFVNADFELSPAGSLLLFVSGEAVEGAASVAGAAEGPERVLEAREPVKVSPSQPNMLTLDYCDLEVSGKRVNGIYFHRGTDMIYQAHGFPDNPWNRSVQYKTEILDKGDFGEGTGFKAYFHFAVEQGTDTGSLQAVIEQPKIWDVRVNGEKVEAEPGEWWLDRAFGVYEIGPLVTPGRNTISLSVAPMNILAELEPVYLLGSFSLDSRPRGWRIGPPEKLEIGSWKSQGMPFYSDKVSYGKAYQIEKEPGREYRVVLGEWSGTVAEVRVNGERAGIIGWQPYELDITSSLENGLNEVEVVIVGSLKNLLGPLHTPWQRGIVTIGDFQQGPEEQPAGSEYDTFDYGLMEDFRLVAVETGAR